MLALKIILVLAFILSFLHMLAAEKDSVLRATRSIENTLILITMSVCLLFL